MLSSVRRKSAALILGVVLVSAGFVMTTGAPAFADSCHVDAFGNTVCDVGAGGGGTGGGGTPNGGGSNSSPSGFTTGPSDCHYTDNGKDVKLPCSADGGWWSNSDQCYWTIADPQQAAPPGESANQGAWYLCVPRAGDPSCAFGCTGAPVWKNTPPPGINRYTPAQAAGMLLKKFVLEPIPIGMAPASKVHSDDPAGTAPYRRTWVGIPVWLWVNGTSTSTWGPIDKSATYGGVTVSAKASVQTLTWNSGDGQTINCGVGTRFNEAAMANQLATDSPTCGFRFQHTSGSGTFTVTATTNWVVTWSGGGQTGTVQMPSTSSSTQVRVGELQSVNTSMPGDSYQKNG